MPFTKSAILAVVAALFTVGAQANRATFYSTGGQVGVCGTVLQDSDFIVALSPAEFADGANCFRRMTVTSQGKTVEVTVADECQVCEVGQIDLSIAAFEQLAPLDVGLLNDVTYEFE